MTTGMEMVDPPSRDEAQQNYKPSAIKRVFHPKRISALNTWDLKYPGISGLIERWEVALAFATHKSLLTLLE